MMEPRADRGPRARAFVAVGGAFRPTLPDGAIRPPRRGEHLYVLAQLSRSMDSGGLDVGGLSAAAVQSFLTERGHHGYVSGLSLGLLRPLLDFWTISACCRPRHLS